jgi:hypothetical protein
MLELEMFLLSAQLAAALPLIPSSYKRILSSVHLKIQLPRSCYILVEDAMASLKSVIEQKMLTESTLQALQTFQRQRRVLAITKFHAPIRAKTLPRLIVNSKVFPKVIFPVPDKRKK